MVLGFGLMCGSRCRVEGVGNRVGVQDVGFRVKGCGMRDAGFGLRIWGSGFGI